MNCEPLNNTKVEDPFEPLEESENLNNTEEEAPFETLEEEYYREESEYLDDLKTDDGYYSGSGCDEI